MKIDLYHLYRNFHFSSFAYPIILNVLKSWAESVGCSVRISVCKESRVNLISDCDVVGFSVYTQTAPAVFRVSDELRNRGKIVILGGPHFRGSATTKEAALHCDVIVNSICEVQWKDLLNGIREGKIPGSRRKKIYIYDHCCPGKLT